MTQELTAAEEQRRRNREHAHAIVRRGAEMLWPGRGEIQSIRANVWDTSGKWRVFRAFLTFPDGPEQLTFTSGPIDKVRTLFDRYYGSATLAPGTAAFVEDEGCMVEAYPLDWKLRGLKYVTNQADFLDMLVDAGLITAAEAPSTTVTITLKRFLPHKRALVRYAVDAPGRHFTAMGKVYSSNSRAERAYAVLESLQAGPAAELLPRPLLLRREWSFVLMELVEGIEVQKMLDDDPETAEAHAAIRATARSIALLHSMAGETEVASREWQAEAGLLVTRLEGAEDANSVEARGLLNALLGLPAAIAGPSVFTHGDFNPRQVLFDGEKARIVDLDRAGPGDPAADVGRFVAALKSRAVQESKPAFRELVDVFVAEYEAASSSLIVAASALPEAVAILHRALRLLHSPSRDLSHAASLLIAEAREGLAASGILLEQGL